MLKPDGALWVIGSYHNIYRVGAMLQDLGFWILNDVVWRKTNPMPNFRGRRFTNAHETLLWCARSRDARYTFNYEAMKALNEDLQMRSDWFLPLCGGPERLKAPTAGRRIRRRSPRRCCIASCSPRPSRASSCSIRSSAPAPPARSPSASAGASSASSATPTTPRWRARASPRSCPRRDANWWRPSRSARSRACRSAALVERGLLRPGDVLYDAAPALDRAGARRRHASSRPSTRGSIHKVGAEVQGAPACNGWDFWHVERDGQLVPIDLLRQQVRGQTE